MPRGEPFFGPAFCPAAGACTGSSARWISALAALTEACRSNNIELVGPPLAASQDGPEIV